MWRCPNKCGVLLGQAGDVEGICSRSEQQLANGQAVLDSSGTDARGLFDGDFGILVGNVGTREAVARFAHEAHIQATRCQDSVVLFPSHTIRYNNVTQNTSAKNLVLPWQDQSLPIEKNHCWTHLGHHSDRSGSIHQPSRAPA